MPIALRSAAALAGLVLAARAAGEDPTARGFDPDPVRPAFSLDGGFAVETAPTAAAGTRGAAFLLDWTNGLLALKVGDTRDDLLASRLSAHLLGTWSLGWVELGAHLPLAMWQRADFTMLESRGVTGGLVSPVAGTALGDLRLGAKVPVLDAARAPLGLGLAFLLDVRLPTGDPQAFTSDGTMVVPSAIVSRTFGRARLDAQVGYAIRGSGQYAQLVVADGLTYGVGASLDLPPVRLVPRWKAIAEV